MSGSILCGIKFVATLNISELHRHPKCAVTNTINKFGEIVKSLDCRPYLPAKLGRKLGSPTITVLLYKQDYIL